MICLMTHGVELMMKVRDMVAIVRVIDSSTLTY